MMRLEVVPFQKSLNVNILNNVSLLWLYFGDEISSQYCATQYDDEYCQLFLYHRPILVKQTQGKLCNDRRAMEEDYGDAN